jgi:demethylmenaquinone methyltransferase/2-methoxy-6-polyprenyl-1,4-benzoquinol methylase
MSRGTAAAGARTEEQTARWVRDMFDRVAPRYDFLNHFLSFHIDRWWRARTVAALRPILDRPDGRILDLCCGSGDLMIALQKRARSRVLGSDFSHRMLVAARAKAPSSPLFEADALSLPLADESLDLITVAFGFRNFANYTRGLAELRRVLKPGGTAAILEFTTPPNTVFRALYHFYSRRILPRLGGWISGSRDAYTYLPESVSRFPAAEQLRDQIHSAGFREVTFHYMTFGAVALHLAQK